jgi:hypothetical protein
MQPEIIDALSIAGSRLKPNDDAFGAAGRRVWVLDGATGLGASLLPGRSDAAWLARTANRLLHAHHAIRDSDQLVRSVIAGLNSAFEAERIRQPEARWQLPCASLLLLTFEEAQVEAVWLGDCRAILQIGGGIVACGETAAGEAEERTWAARLGQGVGASAMLRSESVMEALRESRDRFNTGRGRWVLGLEPAAADHLQCAVFERAGPVTGLAMSDGFSALELKYARHTAVGLIDGARSRGLAALASELREIEEVEDPEGATYPRFKRSDDATAVLFEVA